MKKTLIILLFFPCILFSQIDFSNQNSFDIISWNLEWFPKQGSTTVDSVKQIIEVINAEIIGVQEISSVSDFNQLINKLDSYNGYCTNTSNLNLGYIYKNTLNIDSIYTILNSESYFFAGRFPLVLEMNYEGEDFVIINNHFKCCGDGILDFSDNTDEEFRRFSAISLLKTYIDSNYSNKNVLILGDLNDLVEESFNNNVFMPIINDSINYLVADKYIPNQNTANWSYPSWPSHLDHIIINKNLFDNLINIYQDVKTIRVDNYLGSFQIYDNIISDHLPVGVNLSSNLTQINENYINKKITKKFFNFFGQFSHPQKNTLLIKVNDDGTVEKQVILD
ncbi:endonuclease/exonuclease/phosphatase family protein [Flavobacteriales bacterium]|nr:endonuclease/exonuclease/phosphatase family protein [Flavobacteriales bacterium]